MSKNLIFLIDSGPALELCRQVIANRREVAAANRAYVKSYGGVAYQTSGWTGRVYGVRFEGERHADFKKPNKEGCCTPRARTPAALAIEALPEHINEADLIARTFGVPVSVDYEYKRGHGSCFIGNPMHACGFLWLDGDKGPFGMWIPDIAARVASMEADGYTVTGPAKTFKPEFEGCRQIHQEEWDIIVAQHRLAKKMAESEGAK